jgi:hypothetical protein
LVTFCFEAVDAAAGGGGGGGGGGGAADATKAIMSGTCGSSVVTYTTEIANRIPPTITCAAVEMSTGMVLRCDAGRRSPLNSSNIAVASAIVQGKARSEREGAACAFIHRKPGAPARRPIVVCFKM